MRVLKHVEDHIQFDTYRSWNSFMPALIQLWHQLGLQRLGELRPVQIKRRVWRWLPWPTFTYVECRRIEANPRIHKALDRFFDKNLEHIQVRQLLPRQLRETCHEEVAHGD